MRIVVDYREQGGIFVPWRLGIGGSVGIGEADDAAWCSGTHALRSGAQQAGFANASRCRQDERFGAFAAAAKGRHALHEFLPPD